MKKIIYITFIFVLTSCSKKTDLTKNRLEIGDNFGGGIVAYILTRIDVGYDAEIQQGSRSCIQYLSNVSSRPLGKTQRIPYLCSQ